MIPTTRHNLRLVVLALVAARIALPALAQTTSGDSTLGPARPPIQADQAPADSYAARFGNIPRVHSVDPHIWAYTAEFAEKFKMPKEWITPDLKGADAVAFRMEPTDRTCGWGGNPNSCNENEKKCAYEIYFDNTRHPLPWNPRSRPSDFNLQDLSASFLVSNSNPLAGSSKLILSGPRTSPFLDSDSGRELNWLEAGSIVIGYTPLRIYDKEIFQGTALLSFGSGCQLVRKFWLASTWVDEREILRSEAVKHSVIVPDSLISQIKTLIDENHRLDYQFFKGVFETLKGTSRNRRRDSLTPAQRGKMTAHDQPAHQALRVLP